jgi:hypothetical protein
MTAHIVVIQTDGGCAAVSLLIHLVQAEVMLETIKVAADDALQWRKLSEAHTTALLIASTN